MRRADSSRHTSISKELSRVLRHAPPPGAMDEQGWVPVATLLQHMRTRPVLDELRQVIAHNDKQRFVLEEGSPGAGARVRAAQGHSVALQAPVLQPVADASSVACAVHATSRESWEAIKASGALQRMRRTHIHFATQPQLLRRNAWATVRLRLRLQEAMAAGHAFFLSSNQVLLTEGPLPVGFLEEVVTEEEQESAAAAAAAADEQQQQQQQR